MRINKTLETTIDLLDPNEIFQNDYEPILLKKLNERYVNKCYQSIFIISIEKIIRRSNVKLSYDRLDGAGYIDVQFEVSGEVLIENEILHGCRIIEINQHAITAENSFAGIKLKKNSLHEEQNEYYSQLMQLLQVDYIIPVIVKQVRYIPNKPAISVIATPYIPTIPLQTPCYNIIQGITNTQIAKIEYLLNMLNNEKKIHETIKDKKQYEFFKELMYPYKNKKDYNDQKTFTSIKLEINDIMNIKSGIVYNPPDDDKINERFMLIKNPAVNPVIDNTMIINTELFPVIAGYINEYLLYLYALRGFVTTYENIDSMKSLLTYWKICRLAKF